MENLESRQSLVITLDKHENFEFVDELGKLTSITSLTIQKTSPKSTWNSLPPISWYEKREVKPPYWKLPESIFKLQSLKSLYLMDLDLAELPDSIVTLKNLEVLNISFNKLQLSNELPKFRNMISLNHLIALGNHFDEEEIEKFKKEFPRIKVEYKDETRDY